LASRQPETNFLTLRAQRSFAVQAEDIQVLLQVRHNRVRRAYETLVSLVLLAGGAVTAFYNNGKTHIFGMVKPTQSKKKTLSKRQWYSLLFRKLHLVKVYSTIENTSLLCSKWFLSAAVRLLSLL
jgi:hypothetical protein